MTLRLTRADLTAAERLVLGHEGLRLEPYRCSAGKLTIGAGRNLDDVGLREDEAYYLLRRDVEEIRRALADRLPFWERLAEPRQAALVDMAYNLGVRGLLGFQRMLLALSRHDYAAAALEALASRWASQVGRRASRIAAILATGRYPDDCAGDA